MNDVYVGDAKNLFIKEKTIDVILTDPPPPEIYKDLSKNIIESLSKENLYLLNNKDFDTEIQFYVLEMIRVLKDNGKIIIGNIKSNSINKILENHGFINTVSIKVKNRKRSWKIFEKKYLKHETIIIEEPTFIKMNHIFFSQVHPNREGIIKFIINNYTKENDIILDPFCGFGTIGSVAKSLNRQFILFDIENEEVKISKKNINNDLYINKIKEISIPKIIDRQIDK